MGQRTPLYESHLALNAKIVDFGGWDMPLHYGSQIEEHHSVRRDAGVFDVSHMAALDLTGGRTREFLQHLLANDVARLKEPGKALYSCMLLPSGGVIDDLIVYYMSSTWYRLVVNAGTRDKDIAWISEQARAFDVSVKERRDLAILAVQGPNARAKVAELLSAEQRAVALALKPFFGAPLGDWFIARTGYTGEDGFEIMLPVSQVVDAWQRLIALGVKPAGLGARDTLRLEAGMNLYGNDMDEGHHPLESGLAWTVAFTPAERRFVGRDSLERFDREGHAQFVGLLLEDRGVLRSHQAVYAADGSGPAGQITSGTFSPTLSRSIALARVPFKPGEKVMVDIRGKLCAARIVKPPFVRHGKALIDI